MLELKSKIDGVKRYMKKVDEKLNTIYELDTHLPWVRIAKEGELGFKVPCNKRFLVADEKSKKKN